MKRALLALCLAASQLAIARPLDAEGPCPTELPIGTISRADRGAKPGAAPLTRQAEQAFAAAHAAGTGGDHPWLRDLSGKRGADRRYREGPNELIVRTVCEPRDCDRLRAYIAFEPATAAWGATVIEGRRVREIVQGAADTTLAMHKQVLANALLCAINTDAGAK